MSATILNIGIGVGVLVSAGLYFIPAIIAFRSGKSNKIAILLLNTFLGWSLIGWVVALVWATSKDNLPQQIVINNSSSTQNE